MSPEKGEMPDQLPISAQIKWYRNELLDSFIDPQKKILILEDEIKRLPRLYQFTSATQEDKKQIIQLLIDKATDQTKYDQKEVEAVENQLKHLAVKALVEIGDDADDFLDNLLAWKEGDEPIDPRLKVAYESLRGEVDRISREEFQASLKQKGTLPKNDKF